MTDTSNMIILEKGQTIDLTKGSANLEEVDFGLGWKPAVVGRKVDLDASALAVGNDGKAVAFLYFNTPSLSILNGAVTHSGDDLTGADDGEGADAPDEIISHKLLFVPENVEAFYLTINSFSGQAFRQVSDAFCTVDDHLTGERLAFYDLDEEFSDAQAVIAGKIQRTTSGWSFTAIGKPLSNFKGFLQQYGLNVG